MRRELARILRCVAQWLDPRSECFAWTPPQQTTSASEIVTIWQRGD